MPDNVAEAPLTAEGPASAMNAGPGCSGGDQGTQKFPLATIITCSWMLVE
jgi:hypothetical protein